MIQFLSYSEVIVSEKCSAKQIRMITYLPTSGKYNTTAPSKIKPYGEDIKRLLSEGKTFRLAAGSCGINVELIGEVVSVDQVLENVLRHGAAADVAVANK